MSLSPIKRLLDPVRPLLDPFRPPLADESGQGNAVSVFVVVCIVLAVLFVLERA